MNFNPERLRLGNKILRQRLRGPALAAWYPKKTVSFRDLQDAYRPLGLTMFDEAEDDREEAIQMYVLVRLVSEDDTLIIMLQCEIPRQREAKEEKDRCR